MPTAAAVPVDGGRCFKIDVLLLLFVYLLSLLLSFATVNVTGKRALLVVDLQNCFSLNNNITSSNNINNSINSNNSNGGFLPVTDVDSLSRRINSIRSNNHFDVVVRSLLQHCPNHVAFLSQHKAINTTNPYPTISLTYNTAGNLCSSEANVTYPVTRNCSLNGTTVLRQTLWPDYCVVNTTGASPSTTLATLASDVVVTRGQLCQVEWYSLFYDNTGLRSTGLLRTLWSYNITTLFITGLTLDTSVYYTARDATRLGYSVYVVTDAVASSPRVSSNDYNNIISDLNTRSVVFINASQIPLAFAVDDSRITNKVLPPRYVYKDQLTSWQSASNSCLPFSLCPSSVYCPGGRGSAPLDGTPALSTYAWAPVSDATNEWVFLSPNTSQKVQCSLFSQTYHYYPSVVQTTQAIPLLCCRPPNVFPSVPSAPPSVGPTPTPTPPFTSPPSRIHVAVQDDQVDSPAQITRVALVACLCLGLGITVGLVAGCFLGKKGVINAPKIL